MIEKVAVYLGSSAGNSPKFAANAALLGRRLAEEGIGIVYGGASVGTMWTMASAAIEAGGRVTGVFPRNFKGKKESRERKVEVRAEGLAEMFETADLASRVDKMTELSQACVVLPGSYGTMHELFCWLLGHQLQQHSKPLFILNTDGYYEPLRALFANMSANGFMSASDASIAVFCDTVDEIVTALLHLRTTSQASEPIRPH